MIITQNEAKAVYDAMCALNNVGGTINVVLGIAKGNRRRVSSNGDGSVHVRAIHDYTLVDVEHYETQHAFAATYGVE